MANFTALCLGLFIRVRKGGSEQDPRQEAFPNNFSSRNYPIWRSRQPVSLPVGAVVSLSPQPPTSRSGVDKTFFTVAVNRQIQALLETFTEGTEAM